MGGMPYSLACKWPNQTVEAFRISYEKCSVTKRVLHVHQELKMYVILTAEDIQLYMCNTLCSIHPICQFPNTHLVNQGFCKMQTGSPWLGCLSTNLTNFIYFPAKNTFLLSRYRKTVSTKTLGVAFPPVLSLSPCFRVKVRLITETSTPGFALNYISSELGFKCIPYPCYWDLSTFFSCPVA